MKEDYRLSLADHSQYEGFAESVMHDILPLIVDFYKDYDAIVSGFVYDSTGTVNQRNTFISFQVETDKYYPKMIVEIVNGEAVQYGKIFVEPERRVFQISFSIYGIPASLKKDICKEFDLLEGFIINTGTPKTSEGKTPAEKIKQILGEANNLLLKWKSHIAASEVFLF